MDDDQIATYMPADPDEVIDVEFFDIIAAEHDLERLDYAVEGMLDANDPPPPPPELEIVPASAGGLAVMDNEGGPMQEDEVSALHRDIAPDSLRFMDKDGDRLFVTYQERDDLEGPRAATLFLQTDPAGHFVPISHVPALIAYLSGRLEWFRRPHES